MAGEFTQAQVDALTSAIARGVTSVSYDGRTVNYASLGEMLALRDRMLAELAGPRPTVAKGRFTRGTN